MTTKELKAHLDEMRDKRASYIAGDLGDSGCCFHTAKLASTRAHNSLAPLVIELAEALIEANEFTSSILEDMEHYFENKCCPTADEVNQAAIADSMIRLARGKLEAYLNGGGK